MEHNNPESDEKTLLGDADEVEHPSIEEQLDEKLQQEESEEEDEPEAAG